jgi:hypothetical protein
MPAHIVKPSDHRFLITSHDQTFAGNVSQKKIPLLGDLAPVANEHPLSLENLRLFGRKNGGRHEVISGQRS